MYINRIQTMYNVKEQLILCEKNMFIHVYRSFKKYFIKILEKVFPKDICILILCFVKIDEKQYIPKNILRDSSYILYPISVKENYIIRLKLHETYDSEDSNQSQVNMLVIIRYDKKELLEVIKNKILGFFNNLSDINHYTLIDKYICSDRNQLTISDKFKNNKYKEVLNINTFNISLNTLNKKSKFKNNEVKNIYNKIFKLYIYVNYYMSID